MGNRATSAGRAHERLIGAIPAQGLEIFISVEMHVFGESRANGLAQQLNRLFAVAAPRREHAESTENVRVVASSTDGLRALEELLRAHGTGPRFRIDTDDVERTVFSEGTIVNHTHPDLFERLGRPGGAIGFVVDDSAAAAFDAASLLRSRGFAADVFEGAEPGLPIAFVTTQALTGAALVFRRHQPRMGRRPEPWTERR